MSTRHSRAAADAAGRPRPRPHEPVDQRGQFLLLPLHDLPRDARAAGLSRTRHRVRREGRGARACPRSSSGSASWSASCRTARTICSAPNSRLRTSYLLPSTFAFSLTEEGKTMYPKFPAFCRWRERMENLPTTKKLRAILPPRAPIPHAREWATSHRPKY